MTGAAANQGAPRSELRMFLTALQYFTRLPAPRIVGHETPQLDGVAKYFPMVGWLVGIVAVAVSWASSLVLPAPLPILLSTAATIWMTGAFHEDGLADTFDGLGGSMDRERALEIMKDSRIGVFGLLALLLVLLIKCAALNAMPTSTVALALLAGHPLSRWCAIVVLWRRNYVGDLQRSRAKPLVRRMTTAQFVVGTVFGITPALASGVSGIAGIIASVCVLWWLIRWFERRIAGFTGDTLGAVQQLTEVTFYLAVLATWKLF